MNSCGADRHKPILTWEVDAGMVVLVCRVCGHAILWADESQASFLWDMMKHMNSDQ